MSEKLKIGQGRWGATALGAGWDARCEAFLRTCPAGPQGAGDAAHDLGHVRRVVAAARRIAEAEGADLEVVVPAAWLHDCVTVPKDHPDRRRASRLAAETAATWLLEQGLPESQVKEIAHAIEAHSFSAGIAPETLEARVVQDADRLDALGAVGIARLFATAGTMGAALWHPDDPVPAELPARALDDRRWAVDHFWVKLFRLPETLHTAAARREAEARVAFMRRYLHELRAELGQAAPL
jgi:uncharacterized protein